MFAKTIIDSDAFLDMPASAQALYFHLGMRADDEGFVNAPKKIMRAVGSNEDDLRLLITKRFLIPFDSGVVVIKHWRIHNYIRGDRLKETAYEDERAMLTIKKNGAYSLDSQLSVNCQSIVSQLSDTSHPTVTQLSDTSHPTVSQVTDTRPSNVSIGKDSIGKDSIGKVSIGERDNAPARGFTPPTLEDVIRYANDNSLTLDAQAFVDYYAGRGWTMGNTPMADWRAAVRNWARRDAERQTPKPAQPRKTTFHNFEQRTTAGGSWEEMQRLGETDEEYAARIGKTPEQEEGTPWDD